MCQIIIKFYAHISKVVKHKLLFLYWFIFILFSEFFKKSIVIFSILLCLLKICKYRKFKALIGRMKMKMKEKGKEREGERERERDKRWEGRKEM